MNRVYLSLGSNINPVEHLRSAVKALSIYRDLQISPVYESIAVGFSGQNFYNLVVGFETDLSVQALKQHLFQIEQDNLRVRGGSKFSARTLDLDLLLYGNDIIDIEGLSLPRDEILKYAFVLKPLVDLIPDEKHPVTWQSYRSLWQQNTMQDQQLWVIDFDFELDKFNGNTVMQILVNGKTLDCAIDACVQDLLLQLKLQNQRLAIEINEILVPRSQFEQHLLQVGDQVEVIHAIGGG